MPLHHLPKSRGRTSPRVNAPVNCGLWVAMCLCRFISCRKSIRLVGHPYADDAGGCTCLGAGGAWKKPLLSAQFCYEPKSALRSEVHKIRQNKNTLPKLTSVVNKTICNVSYHERTIQKTWSKSLKKDTLSVNTCTPNWCTIVRMQNWHLYLDSGHTVCIPFHKAQKLVRCRLLTFCFTTHWAFRHLDAFGKLGP